MIASGRSLSRYQSICWNLSVLKGWGLWFQSLNLMWPWSSGCSIDSHFQPLSQISAKYRQETAFPSSAWFDKTMWGYYTPFTLTGWLSHGMLTFLSLIPGYSVKFTALLRARRGICPLMWGGCLLLLWILRIWLTVLFKLWRHMSIMLGRENPNRVRFFISACWSCKVVHECTISVWVVSLIRDVCARDLIHKTLALCCLTGIVAAAF